MNNKIFVKLINKKSWKIRKFNSIKIFYRGFDNHLSLEKIIKKIKKTNLTQRSLLRILNNLDGNFAVIVLSKNFLFAAVDKIRSYPLIYYHNKNSKKNTFTIFDNYSFIENTKHSKNYDNKQKKLFSMSGYTSGNCTLLKDIFQIGPGSFITFKNNALKRNIYYQWGCTIQNCKYSLLKRNLKKINLEIISKLIKSSSNRHIVIPLSAGYDSRLIASGLKEFGYKNIITFSYGRKNNREVSIAQQVAKRLNLSWVFVPYTNKLQRKIILSKEHIKYEKFSDTLTSIHFPQDFFAINFLKKNNLIPKNSIFVNGQTGDFISGNHVPKIEYKNKKNIKDLIINNYINKHYNMWNKLFVNNKEYLLKSIAEKVNKLNCQFDFENFHRIYEILEFEDRQVKYVINGQRLYEFFGYEWRLPLWDSLYLNFWEKVPLKYKLDQKLYKETIIETNWGNVWKDIPINPKNSFPLWLESIRFICKIFFLTKKKSHWHSFEKKYLDYFMTKMCGYAQWSYFKIISDNRRFRNSLSWEIEKYLNKKEIWWDGNNFL